MQTKLKLIAVLALLIVAAMSPMQPARADSWVAPRVTTYYSPSRAVRLIVTPHFPTDNPPYVNRPRGPSAPDRARAVLQRRDSRGRWVAWWQGPLVNEVAPVDALVADSGRYFVAFDDWGDTGNGPNVVVIYGDDGRVIRALSLTDLVPRDYIEALMRSSFSIWWTGGGHRISEDGERLLVSMGIPSAEQILSPTDHFALAVSLATGAPDRSGSEWDRAMTAAAAATNAQRERHADQLAFMTEPLRVPHSSDRGAWDAYLHEAFKRLAPDWDMNNRGTCLSARRVFLPLKDRGRPIRRRYSETRHWQSPLDRRKACLWPGRWRPSCRGADPAGCAAFVSTSWPMTRRGPIWFTSLRRARRR
ncbi:hypothetical protein [Sphingosinicella sp.]|uniref:hypothetical protein n=1 Tax=Sphingosinicella sp. TaxID=1917971 RepID=UPI0040380ECC